MKISVIVVSLNAGDELAATVSSILDQDHNDYEIIVKDGGSVDGSIAGLPQDPRIRLFSESDSGIYDAMNRALDLSTGDYVMFLNCGDYLYDPRVLSDINAQLTARNLVVYGDIYDRPSETRIPSNPELDEFALYRNVPCHQACIYDRSMLLMHHFNTEYRVRADYEQFLWCYYIARARFIYMDRVISSYMGEGFSESRENVRRSADEHRQIVLNYMPPDRVRTYRRRMLLTLAPLRAKIARSPLTGGLYNRIKAVIYKK